MQMNRTLEEFLDDVTLLLHTPEFLEYEETDLEQDLRHEVILCESTAAILASARLQPLREDWMSIEYNPNQRFAARQDEVKPWDL